ncbi:uncharacterized protein N7529_009289 [Penicillium soppii]|uniref:uncharacterized protein n=1 Tax=Penicillium soppii TaxID=69789 RepID=UPI0025477160|nr:uncharacterized protein N7529_009289 [Penicillium soppii]KAJ5855345.1 hypothetical protein N7529_009289 [Penicillium soppii]
MLVYGVIIAKSGAMRLFLAHHALGVDNTVGRIASFGLSTPNMTIFQAHRRDPLVFHIVNMEFWIEFSCCLSPQKTWRF